MIKVWPTAHLTELYLWFTAGLSNSLMS